MKRESEIREMVEINLTSINAYLDEIEDTLTKLRNNPANHDLRIHIIEELLKVAIDSGAIGALEWVMK